MAHIAKYKAHSVGHMLAHYRRDPSCFQRDNIDRERVGLDYTIGFVKGSDGLFYAQKADKQPIWDTVEKRIRRVDEAAAAAGKRRTRKDAVVMADLVVTLPENVPADDAEVFFRLTYTWLARKFGSPRNLMGGFVHRDEVRTGEHAGEPVRDHMHVPFTPILDGRFNYKAMVPRTFYQTMHKELADYLESQMGYRPEIELDEEKKLERAISQVRKDDIDAARDAITAPAEQRVTEANMEVSEARDELYKVKELVRKENAEYDAIFNKTLAAQHELVVERQRLECLRRANDGIEQRVGELESIVADARGYRSESRAGKVALIARIADAADRCAAAIDSGIESIRWLMSIARKVTKGDLGAVKPTNRLERKFDLFSNKERNAEPARAAQDRQRVAELSRAAASWDANRSSNRGRGR